MLAIEGDVMKHENDEELGPLIDKLQMILSRFGIKINYHEDTRMWSLDDASDNPSLLFPWYFVSIHEMLFGSSYAYSIFDLNGLGSQYLELPVIKVLKSLKSDSFEELNIKIDLNCT
jgi:hypothetical protein